MTVTGCSMVVVSAVTHAYWNLLLKKAGGGFELLALSKAVEATLLLPAVLLSLPETFPVLTDWFYPLIGSGLVAANYLLSTSAYRNADFSIAYPVARGATLIFLPLLAFFVLGERIDWLGSIALLTIGSGIALIPLERFSWRSLETLAVSWYGPGMRLAWGAALSNAAYTVWGVLAIRRLQPLTYFATYTIIVGGAFGLLLALGRRQHGVPPKSTASLATAIQIAALNTVSYLLILYALQRDRSSYVTGLRQLAIAIGALLGWQLLKEAMPAPRIFGIGLIAAGAIAAVFAS